MPSYAADSVPLRGCPCLPLATHCLPQMGGRPDSRGRHCLTLIVDTADLAQLAPKLMA